MMFNWIKLDVNILDDAKIKIIRSHPEGNAIALLWIGLLCLAMKSSRPGIIEISDGIPYTIDDLVSSFSIEKKTVELGLTLFVKYRMIDLFDGNTIEIINFSKHQKLDEIERKRELTRVRMIEYRKRINSDALVTRNSVTVTPTDKIRQDKIRQDKIREEKRENMCADAPLTKFTKPTLEEVTQYCQQRKNKVNPQAFINFYESNGWKVGRNAMKSWQAAIITWEQREAKNGNNGNGLGFTGVTGPVIKKTGNAQSDGEPWPDDREY